MDRLERERGGVGWGEASRPMNRPTSRHSGTQTIRGREATAVYLDRQTRQTAMKGIWMEGRVNEWIGSPPTIHQLSQTWIGSPPAIHQLSQTWTGSPPTIHQISQSLAKKDRQTARQRNRRRRGFFRGSKQPVATLLPCPVSDSRPTHPPCVPGRCGSCWPAGESG